MYFRNGEDSAIARIPSIVHSRRFGTVKSRYFEKGPDGAAIQGKLRARLSRESKTGPKLTIIDPWVSY